MEALLTRAPVYGADLFDPAALRAPFEHYLAIRDLGPVARLADPVVYVLARYEEVRDALRASDTLISGKGVRFCRLPKKVIATESASPRLASIGASTASRTANASCGPRAIDERKR